MSIRRQIPGWMFGVALACGGLLRAVAAEPHQPFRGPEIVPAFSVRDHAPHNHVRYEQVGHDDVRPISRITGVRSLNASTAPLANPPAARDFDRPAAAEFDSAIARELSRHPAAAFNAAAARQAHPGASERFQRSPDLSQGEGIQTAARPDLPDQPAVMIAARPDVSPRPAVMTADAIREVPGDSPEPIASDVAPVPPPQAAAPAPEPGTVDDADNSDLASALLLAGAVAGLALLTGLGFRWRQRRRSGGRPQADELDSEPQSIRFEARRAAALSPLEALIRNELTLVEEPVEYPHRLEFYGWPAGLPIARVDAAHAAAETSETPALAGPHFSKHGVRAGVRSGSRKEFPGQADPPVRPASRKVKVAAVHAAHDDDLPRRRPAAPDSETPGPLERALERLARNRS